MLIVAKDRIDADTIRALIDEVKDLILISNCSLTLDEINSIGNLMVEFINNSKKRREELKNIRLDVDDYEDYEEVVDNEEFHEAIEDDLILSISNLFGSIFSVYKNLSLPLINVLYSNVIYKGIKNDAQLTDAKLAVFIIDDIIEHIGLEQLPNIMYEAMTESIINGSNSNNSNLRQACNYGLGLYIKHSQQLFNLNKGLIISTLQSSINIQKSNQLNKIEEKQFYRARDNAIGAIGRFVEY